MLHFFEPVDDLSLIIMAVFNTLHMIETCSDVQGGDGRVKPVNAAIAAEN